MKMSKGPYEAIKILEPDYETEPNWWKLKWKFLKGKTVYWYASSSSRSFGASMRRNDWDNGWGRSINGIEIMFCAFKQSLTIGVFYNFIIHKDGPLDAKPKTPLNIKENYEAGRVPVD